MFGFNHIQRDISFKKNFLKTVVFQINFQEISDFLDYKKDIISAFEKKYPRINDSFQNEIKIEFKPNQTPILDQSSGANVGFEMKTTNGQEVLKFNNTSMSYVVSGQVYKNFEVVAEIIKLFSTFLEKMNVNFINRLAIRKLNIIEFKDVDNPSEILQYLINPELLSNLNYFPNQNFIKQNIHSINYINNPYYLNIRYGLNLIPPNYEIGQTIIDIDLFNTSNISINEINKEAEKINQEIYNVFSWAISENTKHLLQN